MARNLRALLPLVAEYGPGPDRVLHRRPRAGGHRRRTATSTGWCATRSRAGVAPEDALVMASLNPAPWHGLAQPRRDRARLPGRPAAARPTSRRFAPELVLKRGRAGRGRPARRRARVGAADRAHRAGRARRLRDRRGSGGAVRAIGLVEDQVVTESLERRAARRGRARGRRPGARPREDRRRRAAPRRPGRIGLGFVAGSGLPRGALASTVAHDAHNLVVVGVDDDDMAFAVAAARRARRRHRRRRRRRGRRPSCPLPVAGLLSDAPLADVIAQSRACNEAARGARLVGRDAVPDARRSWRSR